MDIANQLQVDFLTSLDIQRAFVADGPSARLISAERDGYIFRIPQQMRHPCFTIIDYFDCASFLKNRVFLQPDVV